MSTPSVCNHRFLHAKTPAPPWNACSVCDVCDGHVPVKDDPVTHHASCVYLPVAVH